LEYDEMIFFDDEHRNVGEVSRSLGVFSILVENGVNQEIVNKALQNYAQKHKNN